MTPGRGCPLHYRYRPSDLARPPDLAADTLYIVGGLYGNLPALEAVIEIAARETGPVALVFNGDFNWFNIDAAGFRAVNREVLKHAALRGNVETEIAGDDAAAGCGCAYPEWVGDAGSLAGWDFSQEALAGAAHRRTVAAQFETARARIIASSHTCLPVRYDQPRWQREFLANWPEDSAAHVSYYQRITTGPAYDMAQAARLGAGLVS